jgi:protein-S-isoprenylcysteine O-methyltransferase Ste14
MTRGWHEVALVGVLFFLIALCMKFVDWWWDWMPKYLFFLIVGLTALALLWAFRRLRARLTAS